MQPLLEALATTEGVPGSCLRGPIPALVRAPAGGLSSSAGLLAISPTVGVVTSDAASLRRLLRAHPDWRMTWGAPRRFLLDRALPAIGAVEVHGDAGLTGRGVAVGVVDTGLDLAHPDLRNADGTTRVAWFVDLAADPLGLHPEAEDRCDAAGLRCAVYSGADIDARLTGGGTLPNDVLGHGTHVTSLAAGNGRSSDPARFVGVAPEASLVIARATGGGLSVTDADVLAAVDILFWLTEDYGPSLGEPALPMVVNLSLGSDFGPHDGSSALGEGLAELVTDEHPGRAVVVAAGNSATLYTGFPGFPEPLGIHTSVNVVDTARVPIVSPSHGVSLITADILVWLEMAAGSDLAVGVERRTGQTLVPPVPPGHSSLSDLGELDVVVSNQDPGNAAALPGGAVAAVVLITGRFAAGETFAVRLEGSGTADVWVQSEGDLNPQVSGFGSLVPAATKQSTINAPASHPSLIAVGATVNRVDWEDREGREIDVALGSGPTEVGATVLFSSAGPSSNGFPKPDLVAPGAWLVGAMSASADPLSSRLSIFSSGGPCSPAPECALVDARHAVTSGTSMASPLVAGAVALLLERDPSLTQSQLRRLLQAGAREPTGGGSSAIQQGAGVLDVSGALRALDESVAPAGRIPSTRSRMMIAASHAEPSPNRPVRGLVQLRDAGGSIADGFDDSALRLEHGSTAAWSTLSRVGPGLWEVALAARSGTGGAQLELALTYDGTSLAEATVPIAVDVSVARHGTQARGGCSVAPASPSESLAPALALVTALAWPGRRSRRGARAARSPGRRGTSRRRCPGWCRRR